MDRRLRPRLTYANVMSTVAVFAALGGGAYAAVRSIPDSHGVIHGCYQKKKGALRLVAAGRKCARSEKALAFNQRGPRGARGLLGTQGQPGTPGAPGRDFTVNTTLAPGQTEVGIFGGGQSLDSAPTGATEVTIPLQLRIPLPAPIPETNSIRVPPGTATALHCPGTNRADPGYFCLYETFNYTGATFTEFDNPLDNGGGVSKYGTVLSYNAIGRRTIIEGTWAVTAP